LISIVGATLRAFLTWLDQQPAGLHTRYGLSRSQWLTELNASRNPFDQNVLDNIRRE
jgi:hypothetical protein